MSGRRGENPTGIDNEPLPFFPSGLELLHTAQSSRVTTEHHAFFLAVHWTLMRAGLRVVRLPLRLEGSLEIRNERIQTPESAPIEVPGSSGSGTGGGHRNQQQAPAPRPDTIVPAPDPEIMASQMTEMPEENWFDKMNTYDNEDPIKFQYVNPICPHEGYYILTLYKMPQNSCLVRLTNPFCPASRERHMKKGTRPGVTDGPVDPNPVDTQGYTAPIREFIRYGQDYRTPYEIYYRVTALERIIFHMLGRMGLRLLGYIPKSITSMYDDNPPPTTTTNTGNQRARRDRDDEDDGGYYIPDMPSRPPYPNPGGIGGDLNVPPVGGGGLGRSDLDPLGRIGGGMLADPRGFRRPPTAPAGMLPPGARFDPFGPVGPNPLPPGRGPPRGPGRGPGPFAGPNPDEPRPDGFDDMFM